MGIFSEVDAKCLRLPQQVADQVLMADSAESLREARERFEEVLSALKEGPADLSTGRCLGLDVEWRPGLEKRGGMQRHRRHGNSHLEPCSTLQVAADSFVVIFDLLALAPEDASLAKEFDDLLRSLFSEKRLVKLGYGLQHDLQRLAASYPHLACFQCITSVLDVQEAFLKQADGKSSAGLAARCAEHFGAPLSKRLQASAWGARPLTHEQLMYAALDAHCLIGLARKLGENA